MVPAPGPHPLPGLNLAPGLPSCCASSSLLLSSSPPRPRTCFSNAPLSAPPASPRRRASAAYSTLGSRCPTSAASRPPRGTSTSAASRLRSKAHGAECSTEWCRISRPGIRPGSSRVVRGLGTLDRATFALAKHHVVLASPAAWTAMMGVPVPEAAPCAPAAARLRCAAPQTTRCAVGRRCSTSPSPHPAPAESWRGRSRAGAAPESPPPASASPSPRSSSSSACATLRPLRPERRPALPGVAGSTTTRIRHASVGTTSCAPRLH